MAPARHLRVEALSVDHHKRGEVIWRTATRLQEFTAWVRRYTEDDELVRSVFQLVDADGSGVLGEDEVEEEWSWEVRSHSE